MCWWCGCKIPLDTPYRGEEPEIGIVNVGVVVCTPACPERPDDRVVYKHPNWKQK